MTEIEAYQLLEVPPNASLEEIKTAYRELARVWHPDRFPDNSRLQQRAQERLKQINIAYNLICGRGAFEPRRSTHVDRTGPREQRLASRTAPQPSPPPSRASPKRSKRVITKRTLFGAFCIVLILMAIGGGRSLLQKKTAAAASSSPSSETLVLSDTLAPSVRVAFWNLQFFGGGYTDALATPQKNQIAAVQRDMTAINPDVIGMEEVCDLESAAIAVSPLRGFRVDVISNFAPREGEDVGQQVAIASRLRPISAWDQSWIWNGRLTPPNGFAFAAYEVAPHRLLLVYALHLKNNSGEISHDIGIREEAMHQLTAHIRAMNTAYKKLGSISWVVGGDFNTTPDDRRFASEATTRILTANGFLWCWRDVPPADRITLPAHEFYPAACFDHIFVRHAAFTSAQVIMTSPQSSGHRAIAADLKLTNSQR